MEAMLEIEELEVAHGEVVALRSISLRIEVGEIVTLIGSNGAGKSTLLRTISGLLPARKGDIVFRAEPITHMPADRIVALGLAHVPEGRRVFPQLSVEDNLKVGAHLTRDSRFVSEGIGRAYEMFPRLAERRRQPAGTLSGGEQQMVALARAMMSRPRLLLLDEPTLGLAPRVVDEVMQTVLALRAGGMTILLVEQNARIALAVADRGYVLETGRIVLADDSRALRRNPLVAESYLGARRRSAGASTFAASN